MRKGNLLPLVMSILLSATIFAGCRRAGSTAQSADESSDEPPALPMLLEVAEQYDVEVEEPLGLAVHPSGGLLIGHKDGVLHVDGRMRPIRRLKTDGPIVAVAVSSDGRIYAAERQAVHVFDGQGQVLGVWSGPPLAAVIADQLLYPILTFQPILRAAAAPPVAPLAIQKIIP